MAFLGSKCINNCLLLPMFEIDCLYKMSAHSVPSKKQTDQVNPKDMSDLLFILPIKVLQSCTVAKRRGGLVIAVLTLKELLLHLPKRVVVH